MPKEMTEWGVGPRLFKILLLYLTSTVILHFSYPTIFVFTESPSVIFPIAGTLLVLVGLIIYAFGVRSLEKALPEGRLLTRGVFSIVRNPMYSGLIVFVSPGIALWFRSWIMLTVPVVGYVVFKLLIKEEDAYLEDKFGQEYLEHKSRVNALIPFPRL